MTGAFPTRIDGGSVRSIDPKTGEVRAAFPAMSPAEVEPAIARCRAAARGWADRPFAERRVVLDAVLARVIDRGDALAETIRGEHGKSRAEAMFSEVIGAAEVIRTHLRRDPAWLRPEKVPLDPLSYPGKSARVEHVPRGVIGLITPWNYPLALPMRTLVPALLAGNGVVWKPSEFSPAISDAVRALLEGLLPDSVLVVAQGGGETGAAVVSGGVDAVVFTGSVATGRKVALAAAERLLPVSLELGGKDAAIVLADCDLPRTVAGIAWGAFHNSGQNCAAIERVYVDRAVWDRFVPAFADAVRALRTASDDDLAEVGPLCTEPQLAIARRHYDDAVHRGGAVLIGGPADGPGLSFPPTVLTDVPEDASLWREETFGPVLPLAPIDGLDDGLARALDSRYGLGLSIWTADTATAARRARGTDVGMVWINNHAFTGSVPDAPWVGAKDSGYGVTGSSLAMKFLTRPQLVLVDRSKQRELWWFPLNAAALAIARTALQTLRTSFGRRIALTVRLLGLLGKRWKSA